MRCWEFGELIAAVLSPIGLPPMLLCRCEERRKWLNEQGERLWGWLCPAGYARFRRAWKQVVRRELYVGIISQRDLHHHLSVVGLGTSERTMARWLDDWPEIASLTIDGQKYYGLPATPVIM